MMMTILWWWSYDDDDLHNNDDDHMMISWMGSPHWGFSALQLQLDLVIPCYRSFQFHPHYHAFCHPHYHDDDDGDEYQVRLWRRICKPLSHNNYDCVMKANIVFYYGRSVDIICIWAFEACSLKKRVSANLVLIILVRRIKKIYDLSDNCSCGSLFWHNCRRKVGWIVTDGWSGELYISK